MPYARVGAAVARAAGRTASPSCRSSRAASPRGSAARWRTVAVAGGVKGMWGDGWHWDLSGSYGRNEIDFYMLQHGQCVARARTSRPATGFGPGGNVQTETNFNFDVGQDFETGFTTGPLSLAMGAEWREEEFEIRAGDAASTAIGPLTEQGFASAPTASTASTRAPPAPSAATTGRSTSTPKPAFTEQLLLAAAVRYEDFERLRRHHQLEADRPLRLHRHLRPARRAQHRLPRADAGPGQRRAR